MSRLSLLSASGIKQGNQLTRRALCGTPYLPGVACCASFDLLQRLPTDRQEACVPSALVV
jgi:hypothetical protein